MRPSTSLILNAYSGSFVSDSLAMGHVRKVPVGEFSAGAILPVFAPEERRLQTVLDVCIQCRQIVSV